jgi:hypothetical protein
MDRRKDGSIFKRDAMLGCDDMEAAISRLRSLLEAAESYTRHAFYESAAVLHLELAQAMERAWTGFEEILEDLDE